MSDLKRAARDAVDAQANTEQVALVLAVLQAQDIARQQQPTAQPPASTTPSQLPKYIALGIGGALALTPLAMAAAMLAIALGIGAVALTICVLVLRGMWTDAQKTRRPR